MRLAIVSDIHANLEALLAVLADIDEIGVDDILCLGDIVGYNASPGECIARLRERGAICIAGNHDRAVCGLIGTESFGASGARAVAWTRRRLAPDALAFLARLPLKTRVGERVIGVHGALHADVDCDSVRLNTDQLRRATLATLILHPSGCRICAFGHTHEQLIVELRDGVMRRLTGDELQLDPAAHYLVNPGAVGQSRSDDPRATYALLDDVQLNLQVRRITYDDAATRARSRQAGLLPPLSFLPPAVRRSVSQVAHAGGLHRLLKHAWVGGWRR